MKNKKITKEMLESNIKTYMLLQFEIIEKISKEEERIQEIKVGLDESFEVYRSSSSLFTVVQCSSLE